MVEGGRRMLREGRISVQQRWVERREGGGHTGVEVCNDAITTRYFGRFTRQLKQVQPRRCPLGLRDRKSTK